MPKWFSASPKLHLPITKWTSHQHDNVVNGIICMISAKKILDLCYAFDLIVYLPYLKCIQPFLHSEAIPSNVNSVLCPLTFRNFGKQSGEGSLYTKRAGMCFSHYIYLWYMQLIISLGKIIKYGSLWNCNTGLAIIYNHQSSIIINQVSQNLPLSDEVDEDITNKK